MSRIAIIYHSAHGHTFGRHFADSLNRVMVPV